jgi:glycosyltransferase involved in cell wall biosynthesis
MRILHFIPTMEGGGAEHELAWLAGEQVRRGQQVHVSLVRRGVNWGRLERSGAEVHEVKRGPGGWPAVAVRLAALVRRLRPNIVQTWLPLMDVLGGSAAILAGSPWVLSERSGAEAYPSNGTTYLREALARRATVIVANSHQGDAYWSSRRPSVPRYVIPNALPLSEIDATPASSEFPRTSAPLILFAGRLSPEKNPLEFVRAVSVLCANRSAQVLICGDGPLRSQIARGLSGTQRSGPIRLAGYRKDIWSLMKAAAAFVSTSAFEGCPTAVMEAMAARCPVVLSDIPAHREMADDARARYFPLGDTEALVSAIVDALLRDPSTDERVRRARAAIEGTSFSAMAARYEAVYDRAIHGARRASTTPTDRAIVADRHHDSRD